jgi:hypothetical protein
LEVLSKTKVAVQLVFRATQLIFMKGTRMQEIYISTDVEADGPIPGQNSMLSFGSAAYIKDKELISTFEVNLECLEGAVAHPETMKWWSTQKEAWVYCRSNLQKPDQAMKKYVEWVKRLPGKLVFVGYPVSYDFMFVYWYLMKFVGWSPFSHSALDIKTLAMVAMKSDYRMATKTICHRSVLMNCLILIKH